MDHASPVTDEQIQRLLKPISEEARGGADAKLSDDFEKLLAEVGKIGRADKGDPDWGVMVEAAEGLLSGKSKDFRAATYLAFAWYRIDGVPGLQRGFGLISGLLAAYWEDAYPPVRKQAVRADVFTWLNDRLQLDLLEHLQKNDVKAIAGCWKSYKTFRELARSRFSGQGPSFGNVDEVFAKLPKELRTQAIIDDEGEKPKPGAAAGPGGEAGFLAPISAGAPTGEDPKYSDEFDVVRSLVAKVGTVAGDSVDWKEVASLSQDILTTHAIDLRCLCWWTIARYRLDKAEGLAEGLAALAACCEKYGDALHPKRPRARSGALSWLADRLEKDLPTFPLSVTPEELKELKNSVERVEAALGDHVDSIDGTRTALLVLGTVRAKAVRKPPAPKPAAPVNTAPSPGGPPAQRAAKPVIPSGPAPEMSALATDLLATAQEKAAGGETAQSLRVRRLGVWLDPAEELDKRKRDCEGPDAPTRSKIKRLFDGKQWEELLAACEDQIIATPYWLDLTVWAMHAAAQTVGEEAKLALLGELRALLTRDPNLHRMCDRHGGVLAARETKSWIADQLMPSAPEAPPADGGPAEGPSGDPDAGPDGDAKPEGEDKPLAAAAPASDTLPAAIAQQFKKKQYDDAMANASEWISTGGEGRVRFLRSLSLAKHCLSLGANHLAFPLFRALERQLRDMKLMQWDPPIAADCLRGYLLSKMALAGLERDDQEFIDQLVMMDPKATTELFRR